MDNRIGLSSARAPCERFLTPRIPIHRVIRVLSKIGGGFVGEAVGHGRGKREGGRPNLPQSGYSRTNRSTTTWASRDIRDSPRKACHQRRRLAGTWRRRRKFGRRHATHDPARQRRMLAGTAGRAEMVGIVDLDQPRRLEIVGVDDAAIVLVVLLAQQFVDAAHEFAGFRSARGCGSGSASPMAYRYQSAVISILSHSAPS